MPLPPALRDPNIHWSNFAPVHAEVVPGPVSRPYSVTRGGPDGRKARTLAETGAFVRSKHWRDPDPVIRSWRDKDDE